MGVYREPVLKVSIFYELKLYYICFAHLAVGSHQLIYYVHPWRELLFQAGKSRHFFSLVSLSLRGETFSPFPFPGSFFPGVGSVLSLATSFFMALC
mgnify:CR=1 FL=1